MNPLLEKTVRLVFSFCAFGMAFSAHASDDVYECHTAKHFVKVSGIQEGSLRYRVWATKEAAGKKPDLDLKNGRLMIEGSGPCRHRRFEFTNGRYRYDLGELGCTDGSEPQNANGSLRVSKSGKALSEQWCQRESES